MTTFLLFLILCVLLFGAGAVLSGLGWLALIGVGFLVVLFVVFGGAAFIRSMYDEIATQRRAQRPWLFLIIGLPAVLGNFGIFAFSWLQGSKIDAVPFYWLPLLMILASMLALVLESANSWLQKVPQFIKGFFIGWAKFLVLPVLAPIGHWRTIRKANPAGDQTGVFVAGASTLWTFIVALFLWWSAVLPLIFIVAFTYTLFAER